MQAEVSDTYIWKGEMGERRGWDLMVKHQKAKFTQESKVRFAFLSEEKQRLESSGQEKHGRSERMYES